MTALSRERMDRDYARAIRHRLYLTAFYPLMVLGIAAVAVPFVHRFHDSWVRNADFTCLKQELAETWERARAACGAPAGKRLPASDAARAPCILKEAGDGARMISFKDHAQGIYYTDSSARNCHIAIGKERVEDFDIEYLYSTRAWRDGSGKPTCTVKEAASLLGTTVKGIYALHDRGKLPPTVGPGRRLLWRRSDLLQCSRRASSPEKDRR